MYNRLVFLLVIMLVLNYIPFTVSSASSVNRSVDQRIIELLNVFNKEQSRAIVVDIPGIEEEDSENEVNEIYREFIIVTRERYLNALENIVYKIKYVYRFRENVIVFAMINRDQLIELINKPWITNIAPSPTIEDMITIRSIDRENIAPVQFSQQTSSEYGLFSSWDVMSIRKAWNNYGVSGSGVVVGVADTGIDFGYQELDVEAIARDINNIPLTATVDEQIVLTAIPVNIIGGNLLNTYNRYVPVYSTYYSRIYGTPRIVIVRITTYYTAPSIVSKSGIYRFGLYEWFFADYVTGYSIILRIPVVFVDANTPGVYDTVVFDLSTAFYVLCYNMQVILGDTTWRSPDPVWLDYSFADEPVFTIDNPVIARDFDGDSVYDFSLGSLAGTVIDTWGITNYTYDEVSRRFLLGQPGQRSGLDSNGKYFVVLTDWHGHGTSVASIIGARGRFNYTGYGGRTYKYIGVAYGAKIAGATGFWFGDMIAAEYWLAGYNYDPSIYWFVPANKRSDVISNSWSYVDLVKWLHQSPGIDIASLIFDELVLFNPYQTVIVFAAGNCGSAYGSVAAPSAGLFIITVGASTNWEYYQLYGYQPGYADDIAMFSSRGPNALGYPKPDVVAVGSYEWAGVRVIEGRGRGIVNYWELGVGPGLTLFGGTSEATPFVSGIIALGLEALYNYGYEVYHIPMVMKVLLKSSADDLEYPVLIQGSGRVNAYKFVKTIVEGDFVAYIDSGLTRAVFENYYNVYGDVLFEQWFIDTAHYTVLKRGESETFTLYLELGSGTVYADAIVYTVNKRITLFNGVYDFTERLFTLPRNVWRDSDYLEIYVIYKNISYSHPYYNITPIDYRYMIRIDAFDYYMGNMYRLNSEARSSTVAVLTIGDLGDRVKGDIIVRLRPAYIPPGNVQAEVVAVLYKATRFSWITFSGLPRYIDGYGEIPVTITVPRTARPGLYEAKIRVFTPSKRIIIPVTILVPLVIESNTPLHTIIYPVKLPFSYDSYTPMGVVDPWSGGHLARTEALDWRIIPILIEDYAVTGLIIRLSWTSGSSTSLEVVVIPPGGVIDTAGSINNYASYKLTARHGYVYNPVLTDQQNARLTIYTPIRWSQIFSNVPVYYHRSVSITDTTISETIGAINYIKIPEYYGLYRLAVSYGSYSGSKLFDTVRLTICIVKSDQLVEEIEPGLYRVTAVFITSPIISVFLNAKIYSLTSESLGDINLTPLEFGYRRYSDGSVSVLNTVYGLYIGSSTSRNYVLVTYTTIYTGIIETVLVLNNIMWHSSGVYYYTPSGLTIVETYYPAIVTTMRTP
ncbi:MAG: S8 family serine peptidase [Desulfurococcaceae archaeon]